jgi:hypothetical protein
MASRAASWQKYPKRFNHISDGFLEAKGKVSLVAANVFLQRARPILRLPFLNLPHLNVSELLQTGQV